MDNLIIKYNQEIEYCNQMAEKYPEQAIIWRSQAIAFGKAIDIIIEEMKK